MVISSAALAHAGVAAFVWGIPMVNNYEKAKGESSEWRTPGPSLLDPIGLTRKAATTPSGGEKFSLSLTTACCSHGVDMDWFLSIRRGPK